MTARYIVGDVRQVLADMPDSSVDLVLTSPPFLALRSYLPADHPDKASEIGSEATPGEFLDVLLDVTEELRRVLTPTGTLAVELGDTYAGSGGAGGDYGPGGWRESQPMFRAGTPRWDGRPDGQTRTTTSAFPARNEGGRGWPLDKSLTLIPELYRFALAYGFNPFTGRTTPTWRIRNVVRWARPNPPVGALGDKFRPATTDIVVACTARNRWFDMDAVRAEHQQARDKPVSAKAISGDRNTRFDADSRHEGQYISVNPAGAPLLDHWNIPTQPYKGAHYATWPEELCKRAILSMCPQRVCLECGEASRRIVEPSPEYAARPFAGQGFVPNDIDTDVTGQSVRNNWRGTAEHTTLGWTDCGHNTWRRGHVLDPFAGSGTTLAVAEGCGRDSTGIDLDARNASLAEERIGGLFFSVENHREPAA